jgi:ribosomal protein S18 acetylase RimI-like enzyme
VRAAVLDDVEAIGEVLVRAYAAAWGETGWEEYRVELRDVLARWDQCETFVAHGDRGVVGSVALVPPGSLWRQIDDPDAVELRMLGVDPESHRQGVARALLDAAADRTRELGLDRLVLQSDDDLIAAHALYDALGFRRRADLDTTVGDGYRALGYERLLRARSAAPPPR